MKKIFSKLIQPNKQLVGTDLKGNKYYLEGKTRSVEFHNKDISYSNLPSIWRSWIQLRKDAIPTIEEEKLELRKAQILQRKVRELEIADEKLRLQEMGEREGNGMFSFQ